MKQPLKYNPHIHSYLNVVVPRTTNLLCKLKLLEDTFGLDQEQGGRILDYYGYLNIGLDRPLNLNFCLAKKRNVPYQYAAPIVVSRENSQNYRKGVYQREPKTTKTLSLNK